MELNIKDLHKSLSSPSLNKVNLLNEIAKTYPDAISFSSGSPAKTTYDVVGFSQYLDSFIAHLMNENDFTREEAYSAIGNYASARGIICEYLARMVYVDEHIAIDPKAIVVTTGAQEAITLAMQTICRPDSDVFLIVTPFYIGVEGAAKVAGLKTAYVNEANEGVDIDDLKLQIQKVKNEGLNPKAIYCTPNYSNPTGICMTLENRHELISICNDHNIMIIEDNTYGFLGWNKRPPSLKCLDTTGSVIHIGSFSKSVFPGLRIGFLLADKQVKDDRGETYLSRHIASIKSMTTNNTAHFSQAMIAGYLLENNYSIKPLLTSKVALYKKNMETLYRCLEHHFGKLSGFSWNRPEGGFFITLELPFYVREQDVFMSAEAFGVIWLPVNFFKASNAASSAIRLAYGSLSCGEIEEGVHRLSQFIHMIIDKNEVAS